MACPCCKGAVTPQRTDDIIMDFRALMKQNDVISVFQITGDYQFRLSPELASQDAAKLFAEHVHQYLQDMMKPKEVPVTQDDEDI